MCGPPSIPLSFQPCGRTPPGECLMSLAAALSRKRTQHLALIVCGVDYWGILFAPHAFDLNVSYKPENRFRRGVLIYLRISPLHMEFHSPPLALKLNSFQSVLWLRHSLQLQTYLTATALSLYAQ